MKNFFSRLFDDPGWLTYFRNTCRFTIVATRPKKRVPRCLSKSPERVPNDSRTGVPLCQDDSCVATI